MLVSNLEKQSKASSNPGVEKTTYPERNEQHRDWFSTFLKYQGQNNAFVEYILTEVENGRQ
jgi:hypothetical protein